MIGFVVSCPIDRVLVSSNLTVVMCAVSRFSISPPLWVGLVENGKWKMENEKMVWGTTPTTVGGPFPYMAGVGKVMNSISHFNERLRSSIEESSPWWKRRQPTSFASTRSALHFYKLVAVNAADMIVHNSNGPTTGSIFAGHLLSASPLKDTSKDSSLASDISLQAAHIIEGIHVVPNKISPQGFDIEGRTIPDIHTRPFNLVISARNVDDAKDLVQILTLTITGGCQWIPILPPYNSIAIDHLKFNGDFEIVTVIIHGIKLDTHMLSASAQQILRSPYNEDKCRSTTDNSSANEFAELPAEEEIVVIEEIVTTDPVEVLIPRNVLFALHSRANSYSHLLNTTDRKLLSNAPDGILQSIASCDTSKSSCVVAIEVVAELVGAIFSIEDDGTCSAPLFAVRIGAINNLIKIMEQCWKVGILIHTV